MGLTTVLTKRIQQPEALGSTGGTAWPGQQKAIYKLK